MTLNEFFAAHPKCALGFSGGVDSAYLLYAGVQAGADIRPYYIKTAFQPRFERDDALRLAGELGVEVTVLELDALADPRVAANPAERCYYCKQNLFRALKARAAADGYTVLLDGTNASDEAGDRPGMRALRELEVRSPLRECGLTKADIRRLSREAGLFTWDKPAYACLATRIPTGEAITGEILARVEGEGLDIDRFLVITYTKAAAAELRGRIVEELSARLERYGFFRCHRSYLVNMQKVQEVVRWTRNSYALRLENGPESGVPLSKGRIDAMRRQYRF